MSQTIFPQIEHVGTVKLSGGMLRIDVKILQAAITRSDVGRLTLEGENVPVWDMTPVWAGTGDPIEAGQAWITGSGKAVMYQIRDRRYISPLSHVRAAVDGTRRFANISTITWDPMPPSPGQSAPQAVAA